MSRLRSVLVPMLLLLTATISAQQLAFPGAEGFGKYATGGRYGSVYHVTNLDDSGPGSFRDAVSQSNRIVVFDVAGVIHINDRIVIHKNITVAGQTAPGEGITVYGNGIALNDDSGNSIIRHIRFRMGKNGDYGKDAVGISAGTDYMFDHVSISWGRDGTFDINGTGIDNVSIQDCIISQGINKDNHSTGGLMQSGRFSIIRTLWIDNKTRNPKAKGKHEFINSVIYNWAEHGYIMGGTEGVSELNMLGNYLIAGPSSTVSEYFNRTTPTFYIYPEDNWLDGNKDGVLNGTELLPVNGDYKTATIVDTPFDYPGVNTVLSAQDAVNYVIANCGASIVRDEVDKLLISQIESMGTLGQVVNTEDDNGISGAVGVVNSGPKPADSDNDGMPDDWEDSNGTDKNTDDAMIIASNGYANVENYINSIQEPYLYLEAPGNLSAHQVTSNSLVLEWVNNDLDTEEFYIEYGTVINEYEDTLTVPGDLTSVAITNLEVATAYYFRIKAVNDQSESAFSEVLSVTTDVAAIAPRLSVNPIPNDGALIGFRDNMKLTWENTTPELGGTLSYDVFFGTSLDAMNEVASAKTGTSLMVGDLQAGRTYYWKVNASNNIGSSEGETWSFTIGTAIRHKVLDIPFDDSTGTTAENLAETNDAYALNMVPEWVSGQHNAGMYFSASPTTGAMVVDHYDALSMDISPFTISLWFKSSGGVSDTYLLHKGTHSAGYGELGTGKWFGIQYVEGNRLTFSIDDNVTKTYLDIANPDQYFNNQWHHLVCIRDVANDVLSLYMDGKKLNEVTDNTGNISEQAELVIGNCNYNFDTPFKGSMDDLFIFDDALSSEEVAYLYNYQVTSSRMNDSNIRVFKAYPNPFRNELIISVPDNASTSVSVMLFDLNGRLCFERQLEINRGSFRIEGLEFLHSGFYTCLVRSGEKKYYCKVIK